MTNETQDAPLDPIAEWYGKFVRARELERQAKEIREEARALIGDYLINQGAEYGTIGGVPRIRYRTYTERRFNTKRFYADHPDLAEEYYEESTKRRMEIIDD